MSGIQADVGEMRRFVGALFAAAGLPEEGATRVAVALVEADVSGRASHGVLQADGYLGRLIDGSMTAATEPVVVSEDGGAVVLDAADMEGHLAAEAATAKAVATAKSCGVAAVAVRRVYHTGVVGRYVRIAAEQGCAALAMGNSVPIMAAPGGAERLVGTNPLAIGFPVAGEAPVVLDAATTAGTIGRVRQALAAGQPLPDDWAVDADGQPTTDAATALKGLLLPAGGAKGFALSFVIDLLPGLLASGGWGPTLGAMRAEKPNNNSFLIVALDIERFRALDGFMGEAAEGVARVRTSRKAEGTARLYTPGERSAETLAQNDGTIPVAPPVAEALRRRAGELGVGVPGFLG